MNQDVLYEANGPVAVVTLNRPQYHNAQSWRLLDQLDAALDRAVEDKDIRVVVVRGEEADRNPFARAHELLRDASTLQGRGCREATGGLFDRTHEVEDASVGMQARRQSLAVAEVALEQLFLPGGLEEIWVNFSDPWPKARHAHRRVIQPSFVTDAARALGTGGMLYVATDDVHYAHQIGEVLAAEKMLFNQYAPWPFLNDVPGRACTGYEAQWRAVGRPLHFFAYSASAREESE